MSQPRLVSCRTPCWMGWSRISFIRAMLVRVLMTAARFCKAPCSGSYSRETTSKNRKKAGTSSDPRSSRREPASATVAMPSRRISDALTTKAASENSLRMERRSTARILPASPRRYSCSALLAFRSCSASMHSWMPSAQAILASMAFWFSRSCTRAEPPTMAKATGSTHRAARASRQSNASRPRAISRVERMDPASSGMKWEKLCSRKVQSAMMVLVRSARSFLPKKDRGILRSCSASVIRRTPLST